MSSEQMQLGFAKFYEKWIRELEGMLHQLLNALERRPECGRWELEDLVCKARSVYAEYYLQKWRSLEAESDVILAFFSPVWLSPLEKSRHWVTGWKPSTSFRLMDSLMNSKNKKSRDTDEVFDEEQKMKLRELKEKVKAEEEVVERKLGSSQTSVADRTMLELAELCNGSTGGEAAMVEEEEVVRLLGELEKVMKAADCLRLRTVEGILGILSSKQSVEFLAAAFMLQIQMRKWGHQKEGKRKRMT